ncbi:MAG: DUF4040 domain-containing protein [Alphaproteobacteria bacterium]|nr:DUF4040 domain-containing protein [Alphaproteobacteria bacterium]
MTELLDILLLGCMATTAVAIINQRNLFAAVMMAGIFSLLSAAMFVVMDAVDVAFTEAAVGAGISTVLMLATLDITGSKEARPHTPALGPLLICLLAGAVLAYATLDMPHYGDPSAPIHHHMADHFVEHSEEEVGMPNIVTSILASYRGYDTFGETTVIFTAAVGVIMLLGLPRKREEEDAS